MAATHAVWRDEVWRLRSTQLRPLALGRRFLAIFARTDGRAGGRAAGGLAGGRQQAPTLAATADCAEGPPSGAARRGARRGAAEFNETFHFSASPSDQSIVLNLWDYDCVKV